MKTEVGSGNDPIWTSNVALTQLTNEGCFPILEQCPVTTTVTNLTISKPIRHNIEIGETINLNDYKVTNTEVENNFILIKENINIVHVNTENVKELKSKSNYKRIRENVTEDEYIENILFFVCNLCSYLCTSDSKIDEHIASEHKNKVCTKPLSLKCPVCPNIFLHKLSLRSHLIHDHKVSNSDLRRIIEAIVYSAKKNLHKTENEYDREATATAINCKNEMDFKYIETLMNTEKIISNEDSSSNDNHSMDTSLENVNKTNFDKISIIEDLNCKDVVTSVGEIASPTDVINYPTSVTKSVQNNTVQKFICGNVNKKLVDCLAKDLDQKKLQKCSVISCKVRLQDPSNMTYHIKCHMSVDNMKATNCFQCPECDEMYSFWKPLSGHLWRLHKIDMELYSCNECDYKTFSSGKLNNIHKLIHGDLKPFICDVCSKGFKNSKQLCNHKITHKDKEDKCVCDICSKAFADRRQLRVHMNGVHNKIKPFLCNYCGYRAASKSALKMHIRHHTGEKPFACNSCNYTTGDHNSLRRHKFRHTGDKPYKCTHCDYACIQSSTYKVHLRTKHPGLEKDLVFTCEHCQFKTVNQVMYLSHLFVVHCQKASGPTPTTSGPESIMKCGAAPSKIYIM